MNHIQTPIYLKYLSEFLTIFLILLAILSCKEDVETTPQPEISLAFTYTIGLDGTVTFDNKSANALNYEWYFGDNSPLNTEHSPKHKYKTSGKYLVILKGQANAESKVISNELIISIIPEINLAFAYTVGQDGTVAFENKSLNAISYEWDFGDSSPINNETAPKHKYKANGNYNVILKGKSSTESKTLSNTVALQIKAPIANFNLSVSKYIAPLNITITNENLTADLNIKINRVGESSSETIFNQKFDNLINSNGVNSVNISKSGLYTVEYHVSNIGGANTKIDTLILFEKSNINDFGIVKLEGITVYGRNKNVELSSNQKVFRFMYQKILRLKGNTPNWFYDFCKKVPIWIDDINKVNGVAEYHPSATWLKQNGYMEEKAKCVELTNLTNYLDWSIRAQPDILLHEYAHAYHDQALPNGFNNVEVLTAYNQAMATNKYDIVGYILGGTQKHYAKTNQMEFFAEMTEAYLGKNDFQPYTKAELKTFDPNTFQLMEKIFGK